MPHEREDYAKVEWEFLRLDPAYRGLPSDTARVLYLHLWCACVHLRRTRFTREELIGNTPRTLGKHPPRSLKTVRERLRVDLPDMLGTDAATAAEVVAELVDAGLLHRDTRGSITVRGVKSKHKSLRGWDADGPFTDSKSIERQSGRNAGDRLNPVCAYDKESRAEQSTPLSYPTAIASDPNPNPNPRRPETYEQYLARKEAKKQPATPPAGAPNGNGQASPSES